MYFKNLNVIVKTYKSTGSFVSKIEYIYVMETVVNKVIDALETKDKHIMNQYYECTSEKFQHNNG